MFSLVNNIGKVSIGISEMIDTLSGQNFVTPGILRCSKYAIFIRNRELS